jgi:glycosyltransferase involved in cell wall biosynthesis
MRICLIAGPSVPVPPPAYGGTEAVVDTLARGLQAAGHDVLLVASGDSTCPVETSWCFERAVGVGVGGAGVELRQVVHGYDAARAWAADVVHDHTLVGPLYAQQFDDLAVVTTNHGPFDAPELGAVYRSVVHRVPIIAISRHQAAAAGAPPVCAVIHHGVDVGQFPVGNGTGGYAVFLGRMTAEKGVHVAAQIAREASVALRIAAKMHEPHEVEYFHTCVEPMLGGGIEYVGELGCDDKLALLGEAFCILNPIQWPEPFGMVMVEALACGTPVLATPRGAVPEIVDDARTGFVADEHDLVRRLADAPALDRAECRLSVEERFSRERLVRDHLCVYERALGEPELRRIA